MLDGKYYLGVDGGQSSTTALICDETGRVLGMGRSGPCNHVKDSESEAKFKRVMNECVHEACESANLQWGSIVFTAAVLGLSGGTTDKETAAREVVKSRQYKLTHDAEIALEGAVAGEAGIIAIAGTGSIAFGKNRAGRLARAGGWGYIVGDEGGAFDVVRRALRRALQMEEGWGRPTALRLELLEKSGHENANDLLHSWYRDLPRDATATFAKTVDEIARKGDEVAVAVLTEAAQALACYVAGVYKNLFDDSETVPVAHIGGTFFSEIFRKAFSLSVSEKTGCETISPRFPPAAGALLQSLRLDGNAASLSAVPEPAK